MRVCPLPSDVISHIRNGVTITNVTHCVEELVTNSIDANSDCIAVRLNLPFYKIQVIDNGEGISADQMEMIGERYATNKCHSLRDLYNLKSGGFRGEALASIKGISSVLVIESRAANASINETYYVTFNRGSGSEVKKSISSRPSKGTTVTIQDFMYNMPVRRNCISESFDLEECHRSLEKMALIHPNISFSLRNDVTNQIYLQTKSSNSILTAFSFLFGRNKSQFLTSVSLVKGRYEVSGYISTEGHISKDLQLIYVNKRYIHRCKLHKLVNSMLNEVIFMKHKNDLKTLVSKSSPSKVQSQCGVFVLNISCPYEKCSIYLEPRKTLVEFKNWDKVLWYIEEAVMQFLKVNNFMPIEETPEKVINSCIAPDVETVENFPFNAGQAIRACNAKNALFSVPAKRLSNEECTEFECYEAKKACLVRKGENLNNYFNYNRNEISTHCQRNLDKKYQKVQGESVSSGKCSNLYLSGLSLLHASVNNNSKHNIETEKKFLQKFMFPCKKYEQKTCAINKVSSIQETLHCSTFNPKSRTLSADRKLPHQNLNYMKSSGVMSHNMHTHDTHKKMFKASKYAFERTPALIQLERVQSKSTEMLNIQEKCKKKNTRGLIHTFSKITTNKSLGFHINDLSPIIPKNVSKFILRMHSEEENSPHISKCKSFHCATGTSGEDVDSVVNKYPQNLEESISLTNLMPISPCPTKCFDEIFHHHRYKDSIKPQLVCEHSDGEFGNWLNSQYTLSKDNSEITTFENSNKNISSPTNSRASFSLSSNLGKTKRIHSKNVINSKSISNVGPLNSTFLRDIKYFSYESISDNSDLDVQKSNSKTTIEKHASNFNDFRLNITTSGLKKKFSPHFFHNEDHLCKRDGISNLGSGIKRKKDATQRISRLNKLNSQVGAKSEISFLEQHLNEHLFSKNEDLRKSLTESCYLQNTINSSSDSRIIDNSNIIAEGCLKKQSISCNQHDTWFTKQSSLLGEENEVSSETGFHPVSYSSSRSSDNLSKVNLQCNTINVGSSDSSVLSSDKLLSPCFPVQSSCTRTSSPSVNTKKPKIVDQQLDKFLNKRTSALENVSSIYNLSVNEEMITEDSSQHSSLHVKDSNSIQISHASMVIQNSSINNLNTKKISAEIEGGNKGASELRRETCCLNPKMVSLVEETCEGLLSRTSNCLSSDDFLDKAVQSQFVYMVEQSNLYALPRTSNHFSTDQFQNIIKPSPPNASEQVNEFKISNQLQSAEESCVCSETVSIIPATNAENLGDHSSREFMHKDPVSNQSECNEVITGCSSLDGKCEDTIDNSKACVTRAKNSKLHFFLSCDSSPFMPRPAAVRQKKERNVIQGSSIENLKQGLEAHVKEQECFDISRKWKNSDADSSTVEDLLKNWENPMFERSDLEVAKIGYKGSLNVCSILNMYHFSKKIFSTLRVVGQVDSKFIACVVEDVNENFLGKQMLVLFDQHAIHERIRLEELIEDLFQSDSGCRKLKAVDVSPSFNIEMESNESRLLRVYMGHLEQLGIKLRSEAESNTFEVLSVPICLSDKINCERKNKICGNASVVENVIREWLMMLEQTRSSYLLPKTLVEILNSQACRGAIKFGDPLDFSQCKELMKSLATCNLPFQCAHGRPSIAPILDLEKVESSNKRSKPQLWKLAKIEAIETHLS